MSAQNGSSDQNGSVDLEFRCKFVAEELEVVTAMLAVTIADKYRDDPLPMAFNDVFARIDDCRVILLRQEPRESGPAIF